MKRARAIGDPENKVGLSPCDHALLMIKAWSREKDRLERAKRFDEADLAQAEMFRWSSKKEKLFRNQHGIEDISGGVAHRREGEFIWIATASSGERALYRGDSDTGAAFHFAKYFIDLVAVSDVRENLDSKSRSGKSVVAFSLQRKREVKVDNLYQLEDTGYRETRWRFGSQWSVEVRIEPPLLVEEDLRDQAPKEP